MVDIADSLFGWGDPNVNREAMLTYLREYRPEMYAEAAGQTNGAGDDTATTGYRLICTPAADIKPRRIYWLWEQRLALGTIGLLAGDVGLGKSTLAYWLAAQISRGQLPGEHHGNPKTVLVCATEDSWEHTIIPRLIATHADLTKILRLEVMAPDDAYITGLSLPRDLADVEQAAKQHDATLLLLDPLMSRLAETLDTHRDGDVRRALEPLAALADRAQLATLGIIHHNKSGSNDPLQLVMASKAFTAVARSVHSVIRDPDDETGLRRLFGTPKNNLGRGDLPTLAFTITSTPVHTAEGPADTGTLQWGGEVDGTIAEAIRRSSDDDHDAVSDAAAWLHDYLTINGGTARSGDIKTAGMKQGGHSLSALKRARQRIHAPATRDGFPSITWWSLPNTQPETQSDQQQSDQTPGETHI